MSDEKKPQTRRVADPEIQAMAEIDKVITESLEGLSEAAQSRVMAWVKDRHFATGEPLGCNQSAQSLARDMERV